MSKTETPYSIRLGSVKPELEKIAFEKDIKLPQLIKRVLKAYVKKRKDVKELK